MHAVLFTGIQGSGKTTFYKEHFFATHIRISLDLLRTRHRESRFLDTCFETRMRFVVDNTNPAPESRKHYIDRAAKSGYRISSYFFETSLENALKRNSLRTGKEFIPEIAIRGTLKKLVAPSLEEGFDDLYVVTLTESGAFNVKLFKSRK